MAWAMAWAMDRVIWRRPAALRRIYPNRPAMTPGGPATTWTPARFALALLVCLAAAGCAARDRGTDDNRSGGFYGGVSGGVTLP